MTERGLPRGAAVLAIVATYVQFLLWAQFGFLRLLRERLAGSVEVQIAMAAMGIAGLAASFATARALGLPRVSRLPASRRVALGLAAAGLVPLFALSTHGLVAMAAAAAAIGAATAVNTVTLAAELGRLLPRRRFGLTVGTGTGLAYLLCNLPPLFEGSPARQAGSVAAFCVLAAVALARPARWAPLPSRAPLPPLDVGRGAPLAPAWLEPRGLIFGTLALAVLVGLDSAAFARIQASPDFQALTWGGGALKPMLGLVHLAAALAGGWLLDRGRFSSLLTGTWMLFATAFTVLGLTTGAAQPAPLAGPLYAVGISLYSVALVVLPASAAAGTGLRSARWRAAVAFGVAGWIGSALGVGMAQDLGRIPRGVLLGAGGLILLLLLAARWRVRQHHTALGLALVPATGALAFVLVAASSGGATGSADDGTGARIARGRAVYIAEGCIHCHSQYVRPASLDVELWGPYRPLDRGVHPVLIGTRRQGPDLSNAGNRRSELWHRLHLIDPAGLSPGSRMPSYAHLFAGEGQRGEDLVAYLASLGADTLEERRAAIAAARMPAGEGSAIRGRVLFARQCSACHGPEGHGDGRWAPVLATAVLDLGKPRFRHVGELGGEPLETALARIVKFGLPGTSMPGHETFSETEIADLAAFVATLPGTSGVGTSERRVAEARPR